MFICCSNNSRIVFCNDEGDSIGMWCFSSCFLQLAIILLDFGQLLMGTVTSQMAGIGRKMSGEGG